MERPIFILGQARSGSTLLQRVLNSIDNVVIYGEHVGVLSPIATSYVNFLKSQLGNLSKEPADPFEAGNNTLKRLKDPNDFSANVSGFTLPQFQNAYRQFVRSLIHNIPTAQNYRWGFKEVGYRGAGADAVFQMLKALFPEAVFIFLVRNPIDQIASKEGTGWWSDSLEQKALIWHDQATAFLRCHKSYEDRSFFLRYEDFIDPQNDALKRLFKFLGYEYTARQHEIIFQLGKVGGAATKPVYAPEVLEKVRAICLTPDIGGLYAA